MMIAKYLICEVQDTSQATLLLKEISPLGLLRLEDVLPLFSTFASVLPIIQQNIGEHNLLLQTLKRKLTKATEDIELIKQRVRQQRYKYE